MKKLILLVSILASLDCAYAENITTTIDCKNIDNPINLNSEDLSFTSSTEYDNSGIPLAKKKGLTNSFSFNMVDIVNLPSEDMRMNYVISFLPKSDVKNLVITSKRNLTKATFTVEGVVRYNFNKALAKPNNALPYSQEEQVRFAYKVLEDRGLEDSFLSFYELPQLINCAGTQIRNSDTGFNNSEE